MKMNQKGFANMVLVVVAVVILLGVASYFLFFQNQAPTTNNQNPPISNNNPSVTPTPTNKIVPPNKILKVSIGLISKQFSPDFYPKVSADGSKIAFWKSGHAESGVDKPEESGLWIMNVDGTGAKRIMKNPVGQVMNFEWSPITDTHYNERYVFAVVGNTLKVVTESGEADKVLTTQNENVSFPRWISVTDIAFIDKNDGNKLKVVDVDGTRQTRKGSDVALVYGEYRNNALDQGVIKSVTFDGVVKQLTPDNENGAFPVLSPDGKKVAYISFWSGPQKIMVMNVDGSNKVQVGSGENPSWSFDNARITYNLTQDNGYNVTASDVYVVNANGSGNKKVEREIEKGPALNPRWFPSGKHIVLDYSDKGVGTIEIVPVE